MSIKVEAILTLKGREVFTTDPEATVAEAAAALRNRNIGALVVTDDHGAAIGILSERDIVRAYANQGIAFDALLVRDLMTAGPLTCSLGDDGNEIMDLMTDKQIRHVPVVDAGALVGMISLGDLVKHRLDACLVETDQLKRYIATA